MTPAQENQLIEYLAPPEGNREKLRVILTELEIIVPGLVSKWLEKVEEMGKNTP